MTFGLSLQPAVVYPGQGFLDVAATDPRLYLSRQVGQFPTVKAGLLRDTLGHVYFQTCIEMRDL